ncbi:hypothetical protein M011DRAFT_518195 [Sporormia fimetaria CBS 119925]|uniref:Uncharacterized protein n=1 Tax=Sporormia fimetaria CBS 119925 TaxID=1340428 RepID=A0A6A6VIV7_9PLEO|nr:hypothetical protein M011DRAFT_518195 [Sporormia fimetaria CBS 119925]
MPAVPLRVTKPSPSTPATENPLPPLLHTPSGLALLDLQGTIHFPPPESTSTSSSSLVGKLAFPFYNPELNGESDTKWMKRVYLYVGENQRLNGEVKKLPKPFAVIRKKGSGEGRGDDGGEDVSMGGTEQGEVEELEIVEIVKDATSTTHKPRIGFRAYRTPGTHFFTHRDTNILEQRRPHGWSTRIAAHGLSREYYHQCQPGASPQPQPSSSPSPSLSPTTDLPGSQPTPTGTPTGSGPGRDLQTGYLWIRGVAAPNFHKYMQSSPLLSPGPAVLGSYTTAGQFAILSSGQLVQLISSPSEPVKYLYAQVSSERSLNDLSLLVSWSETPNTYGAFAWNGDGLVWNHPDIKRPNAAAWYVCQGQKMYVNLGNYLYGTPSGCADQTIHYYNDKRAND